MMKAGPSGSLNSSRKENMTTNLTGNAHPQLTPGGIPDLVLPHVKWDQSDYAALEGRLDFYGDFISLYKFRNGQITEYYPVIDPDETAAAIANINLTSGLLPRECLFWGKLEGTDRLGVYIPPQVWPVVVRDESQASSTGSGQAWRVPLPGLIFVGHSYDYSLWAVTERPAVESAPLYLAPCPNISLKGVCRGNAPFPKAAPASGRRSRFSSAASSTRIWPTAKAGLTPVMSWISGGRCTRPGRKPTRWMTWC
jgi:hypothetical protein